MISDTEQGQILSILVDLDPGRGKSPFCERVRMVVWQGLSIVLSRARYRLNRRPSEGREP